MNEKGYMSQDEFMRHYNENNREQFNPKLFERDSMDIVRELEKVILSCERNRYFTLKVLNFRVITNYEEVQQTLHDHEEARLRKKNKDGKQKIDNPYDFINLRDSDVIILEVNWYISINNGKKPDPNKPDDIYNYERTLQVLICVPLYVDKYYMRINGTLYNPIMQIVDRSVYNNASSSSGRTPSITQKTMFQPIRMFRTKINLRTADGQNVPTTLYTTNIYNKTMDGMKYILAVYGLYGAMEFMDLPYIHYDSKPHEDTTQYYSFGANKGRIYVIVPKYIFDNDYVMQTFVATIVRNFNKFHKQTNLTSIFDPRYWVMSLGGEFNAFNLDKGIAVLDSLEDAYDLKTKEMLRLPNEDKENIYCVLRWMFREFNILRGKDINDVSAKRVRIAEYFANMYAVKMSRGLYRITDMGKNVTMDKIVGAIYTNPMYLVGAAANGDKLLSYRSMVNDNDAFTALSFTYKGISGLGDQGMAKKRKQKQRKAAVPLGFKLVQPTQLGIIDMDTSSAGDPGVSGMMCPMCNINDDGSFVDYEEPNEWRDSFSEIVDMYYRLSGMEQTIEFKKKAGFAYDYIKEDLVQETLQTYKKLMCPVRDINGKIDYSKPPIADDMFTIVDTGVSNDGEEYVQLDFGKLYEFDYQQQGGELNG